MKKIKSIIGNLKNVKFGAWVRMGFMLAVMYLTIAPALKMGTGGWTPEQMNELYVRLSLAAGEFWAAWKNNSFTPEATLADKIKDGELFACEIEPQKGE